MRNTFLILLFGVYWTIGGAQEFTNSEYIRTFPHYLQLSVSSKYTFDQSAISVADHSFNYQSENLSPGIRLQYDKWGIGFQLPANFLKQPKDRSATLGMEVQAFPTSMMINAGISRNRGYYGNVTVEEQEIQLLNPQVWHLYFNPIYVFNGKRFSMNGLFQLDHHQLQSSGTPLVGLRLDYLKLKNKQPEETLQHTTTLEQYAFRQNGLEYGYAYTYVLSEKYFIAAFLKGNFVQSKVEYTSGKIDHDYSKWSWSPVNEFFLAFGYQGEKYFGALQIMNRRQGLVTDDVDVLNKRLVVQLMGGFRLYRPSLERKMLNEFKKWRD